MTTTEFIVSLLGTGTAGALLGKSFDKWINKRKDELEIELKEQVFYKNIIADMKAQRDIEHKEMEELKEKIEILTKRVHTLINDNKEKDVIIAQQKNNIKRWEETCKRLEKLAEQERKENNKLVQQIKDLQK